MIHWTQCAKKSQKKQHCLWCGTGGNWHLVSFFSQFIKIFEAEGAVIGEDLSNFLADILSQKRSFLLQYSPTVLTDN